MNDNLAYIKGYNPKIMATTDSTKKSRLAQKKCGKGQNKRGKTQNTRVEIGDTGASTGQGRRARAKSSKADNCDFFDSKDGRSNSTIADYFKDLSDKNNSAYDSEGSSNSSKRSTMDQTRRDTIAVDDSKVTQKYRRESRLHRRFSDKKQFDYDQPLDTPLDKKYPLGLGIGNS